MLHIRSSLVMYKYIALVDVFRILEAPQNVFLLFFFFSFSSSLCTHVLVRPGPSRRKDPSSPPSYENTHFFWYTCRE